VIHSNKQRHPERSSAVIVAYRHGGFISAIRINAELIVSRNDKVVHEIRPWGDRVLCNTSCAKRFAVLNQVTTRSQRLGIAKAKRTTKLSRLNKRSR
jgi:hypothetical protein